MLKVKSALLSVLCCVLLFSFPVMAAEVGSGASTETETGGVQEEGGGTTGGGANTDATAIADEESWSTGNAINDILNNDRYAGAVESITWITTRIDSGFIMFVTIVSFTIICCALGKNILAGAYAAFPKFWDKVDDAHKRVEAWNISGIKQYFSGGYQNTSAGTVRDTLFAIIPNVKACTSFDEGMVEPKHYFMKAIPEMVAVVIIGVFIYNGYYRDTALLVGSVGAEAFERAFWNIDPKSVIDRLTQTTGMPSFATDNAVDTQGRLINAVTKQVYRVMLSKYSDVTTATAKAVLGADIEAWAIDTFGKDSSVGQYVSDEPGSTYDWAVDSVKLSLTELPQELVESEEGNKATMLAVAKVSDYTFDSTKEAGLEYCLQVRVTFSRVADDGTGAGTNHSYQAGSVNDSLNQMNQSSQLIQSTEVKACNAQGGIISAPAGFRFRFSGSNSLSMTADGITILSPGDRGYYSQLSYTGASTATTEYISFASYNNQLWLEDEAGTTKYRFQISIIQ